MKCPVCKKDVPAGAPEMPFCGERCRLIDLGVWADEGYRIPVPIDETETPPETEDCDE